MTASASTSLRGRARTSWCRAPSRCSFSITSLVEGPTRGHGRDRHRHRGRLLRIRLRTIGGETAECPASTRMAITISAALRWARPSAARCCHAARSRPATLAIGLASSGVTPTTFRWSARSARCPASLSTRRRRSYHRAGRRGAADADAALREIMFARDPGNRRGEGPRTHHRRRFHRQYSARAAETFRRRH